MRRSNGFTIIELLVAITVLLVIAGLAVIQKNSLEASQRDAMRKTAVNSMYYGLTQGYYRQAKSYPVSINEKNLPYIDKALFTDPEGKKIGTPGSDYHYHGLNCEAQICQKFELSAKLEKEGLYQKSSNN